MNLIKERRKQKAICSKCQSPDYRIEQPDFSGGKPIFICNSCGNFWHYGKTGGKYTILANR